MTDASAPQPDGGSVDRETSLRKIDAEIAKLIAETGKINAEARWYPVVTATAIFGAAAAFLGAIIALTKIFLG